MDLLVNTVGSNIKEIRKLKKLTQEELAEICGLQTSYLAGVERGERNITLQTLQKIISGLDIPAGQLFDINKLTDDKHVNKNQLIEILCSKLVNKSENEIRLIIKIANEIFSTY